MDGKDIWYNFSSIAFISEYKLIFAFPYQKVNNNDKRL